MDPRHRHHGKSLTLSLEYLREMTREIRDVLEPDIARNGPEHLPPDTILSLLELFSKLHSHSADTSGTPAFPEFGLHVSSPYTINQITMADLQRTRIHKALLLITGRGTRWPGRLVDICDALIDKWTQQFGSLENIRPLLYERGGRLSGMHEERDLSRHALLVKWLSDRTMLVSPLQAMEHGHLDFKPGHWWIHPIFAFREGIIDSPDPYGGVTADPDGTYAITLTGYDEVKDESSDLFTYRVRKGESNHGKLLQAILPPKQPIRVLRSHTLRSACSPIAGIRYDGLYKVVGYSVKLEQDKVAHRKLVKLRREPVDLEQPSMREVRKSPRAEDVDDYIEYKRLREIRQRRLKDISRRVPKSSRLLGVIPALQEEDIVAHTVEDDELSITSGDRRSIQLGETEPGLPLIPPKTSTSDLKDSYFPPMPNQFDGANTMPGSFDSTGMATKILDVVDRVLSIEVDGATASSFSSPDAYSPLPEESPTGVFKRLENWTFPQSCSNPGAHGTPRTRQRETSYGQTPSPRDSRILEREQCGNVRPCLPIADKRIDWQKEKATAREARQNRIAMMRLLDGVEAQESRYSGQPSPARLMLDHKRTHELYKQMRIFGTITEGRRMGKRFYEELGGVLDVIDRWQGESLVRAGVIESCLVALAGQVRSIREPMRVDWEAEDASLDSEAMRLTVDRYRQRSEDESASKGRSSQAAHVSPTDMNGLAGNIQRFLNMATTRVQVDVMPCP